MSTDFMQQEERRGKSLRYDHILEYSRMNAILSRASSAMKNGATDPALQQAIEETQRQLEEQRLRIKALEDLNTTDELTGLSNRRGFERAYTQELSRIKRGYSTGGILMMLDIDNMSNIQAVHCETAADKALRLVANLLQSEIRAMDVAARLSEEALIMMLVNTSKDDILERTQALIAALNKLSFIWGHEEVQLSVSVSLKSFDSTSKIEDLYATSNIFGDRKNDKAQI